MAFPKRNAFSERDQYLSGVAQALSHPARLRILRLLDERPRYVSELTRQLPLQQSAVSSHLEMLRRYGLISVVVEGRWNLYCIEHDVVEMRMRRIVEYGSCLGCDLK